MINNSIDLANFIKANAKVDLLILSEHILREVKSPYIEIIEINRRDCIYESPCDQEFELIYHKNNEGCSLIKSFSPYKESFDDIFYLRKYIGCTSYGDGYEYVLHPLLEKGLKRIKGKYKAFGQYEITETRDLLFSEMKLLMKGEL